MISEAELRALADTTGVAPGVVEKDYVIGWILAGISEDPHLQNVWIFKGGTCLKKCFFETYRFSEDLDFTITDAGQLNEDFLSERFRSVAEWVADETGINLLPDRHRFDVYEHDGRLSCEGRLYYQSYFQPLNSSPRVKLDLTASERIVLQPDRRRIFHPYTDEPDDGIVVSSYDYAEVFGEKVRALVERAHRGAVRDLYDVIHFHRNRELRPAAAVVRNVVEQKCAFKGIEFPTLEAVQQFEEAFQAQWEHMLAHQLPDLLPFAGFWNELPSFFDWLAGAAEPEELASFPGADRGELIRPAIGGFRPYGVESSVMEVIRFAAANRLCVELDYETEDGRRSSRVIEPYSLRRTQDDEVLLYAVRSSDGGIRSYRVDRIQGADLTDRSFQPRYRVELSPSSPLVAPEKQGSATSLGLPDYERIAENRPKLTRTRTRTPRRPRTPSYGPKYRVRCSACGKVFTRKSMNLTMKPHKRKDGSNCFGGVGIFEGYKY